MSNIYEGPLDKLGYPIEEEKEKKVYAGKLDSQGYPVEEDTRKVYTGELDAQGYPIETSSVVKPKLGPLRSGYKTSMPSEPVEEIKEIEEIEEVVKVKKSSSYGGKNYGGSKFFGSPDETPEDVEANKKSLKSFGRSLKAFGRDLEKVAYSIPRGVVDLGVTGWTQSLTGLDMSELKSKDREALVNGLTEQAIKLTTPALRVTDWDSTDIVNPETGNIGPIETPAGMAFQMGAMVLGAGKISSVLKATKIARSTPKLSGGAAILFGGEITTQVMIDPDTNLFNLFEDAIPEDAEGKAAWVRGVSTWLATDPDDTEATKRLKLLGEGLGLSAILGGITNARAVSKFLVGKHPSQFSKEQQEEIVMKALEEERMILNMQDPKNLHLVNETVAGREQVAKQSASTLKKLTQKYFTSRGYASPLMFQAANNAKYMQRQLITTAQNVAERLDIALASSGNDKKLVAKVNMLLEADLTKVLNMDLEKQVSFFAKNRNIPENVAAEILNFRKVSDGLSERILNTKGFSDEAKEAIENNIGSYIRRSYRAYEDPNYKPSSKVVDDARNSIVKSLKAEADIEGLTLTDKEAIKKANKRIEDLLEQDDEIMDYVAQLNRVSDFRKKNVDLSPEIRELLGEIKNPSENIILSITKAARISEMQQFYNVANQLSKGKGGYIQTEKNTAEGLTEQITGTNSILDYKYTTPEMKQVILNQEESFEALRSGKGWGADTWRFYVGLKGTSQSMKTVYDHTTHARNIIGGAQFMIANGRSFATANSLKSMSVIENKVFGARATGGRKSGTYKVNTKALTDLYEEYLGLGIINTSVNVNQFREMLGTGFQGSDNIYRQLGVGDSKLTRGAKTVVQKPTDVYMGSDDFYKIAYFNDELDTLKKAFPDADEILLKQRAASVVKNTMPNYDAIPKGLKQLRNLPFGNFVAFPAEIMRTSFNIMKQASIEINSTNSVIKRRGQLRLAGFATANIGYTAIADMAASSLDMSVREIEDRRVLKAGRFSSAHDLIYSLNEEGKYHTTNTEYLNSYYYFKEPLLAAMDAINTGKLKGEELDDYLLTAAAKAIGAFTAPFTDEAMILEPVFNLLKAGLDREGKDRQGKQLFADKDTLFETGTTVFTELLEPLVPGSALKFIKLSDALNEKANKTSGRQRDIDYAKFEQLGIKTEEYVEDDYLGWAVSDYRVQNKANKLDNTNLETTAAGFEKDYFAVNATEYQYQQNLWVKASAYERLFGPQRALRLLVSRGLSIDEGKMILKGKFKPIEPVKDPARYRREAVDMLSSEKQEDFRKEIKASRAMMHRSYKEMGNLDLTQPKDFDFKSGTRMRRLEVPANKLLPKATGGEISEPVANAPTEPDERINKLTGLPYNEGAGAAYMDADDPLRAMNMAAGGRAAFPRGGMPVESAIKWLVGKADETAAQRKARRVAENSDSSETQIGSTEGTAKKAIAYLDEQGAEGLTLDYGAGFGKNAKAVKADETFEPFPKEGFKPSYIDSALIPEGRFGRLISTNVLNVLPRDIRDDAVLTIGKSLKEGGQAVVQAWDISAIKARLKGKNFKTGEEANSSRSLEGGKFQKGFSKAELRDYVQETLGDGFEVSTVPNKRGISMSSVLIKKLAKGEKRLQKNCGGKVLDTLRRNNR